MTCSLTFLLFPDPDMFLKDEIIDINANHHVYNQPK